MNEQEVLKLKNDPYIQMLRNMSFQQKAMKVFELTEMTRMLFKKGLEMQFPELSSEELHKKYLQRLNECHNSDY